MSGTYFTLNQKYNNLKTQENNASSGGGGVPTSSTLADVLLNGNSAGASDIDMNTNNIDNVDTINGVIGAGQLTIVGDGGISMTSTTTGIILTALADDITLDSTAGAGIFLNANAGVGITSNTGDINLDTPSGVVNINGVPYPVGADTLQQVLTAGNTSTTAIILTEASFLVEDAVNPATLFTQQTKVAFSATDATGSPQYDASVSPNSIFVQNSNGDSSTLNAGSMAIASASSTTTYTTDLIEAGNLATSFNYQVSSNGIGGYGRLDLTSGDLTTVPPRAVLQAFVDLNAPPAYVPNINLIDLGGVNGEELLISNGNSDSGLAIAYNTIKLYSDPTPSNSFIELRTIDAGTSAGSSLLLGQQSFDLTITNQTAITIGQPFTDPVVFRRNISTTTNTGLGQPVGMLENSVVNATTTGTTTLTTSNAFATIINTPTAVTRIFVLPAPTVGTTGYWYAVCNKSTAFTIAVQYPALTTIATIPVATNATNGGSVARFAVGVGGASYFRVN